jgi:spermidine synthase
VILLNVPDPSTAQLNRFYTKEFFGDLKAICNDGAVLSTAILPGAEYQGPVARAQLSTLANTLKGVFDSVLIVPGDRIFYLASDGPLSLRIGGLAEERGIETKYVNRYYIDDDAVAERSNAIGRTIDTAEAANADFRPISYYRQIAYWASFFDAPLWIGLCLPLLVLALIVRRIDTIGLGIGLAGLSATALEIVLLLAFQALCGSLYQAVGMFVASFMVGLAAGAAAVRRRSQWCTMKVFIVLQGLLCALALLTGGVLTFLDGKAPEAWVVEVLLSVLMLLVGGVVGGEFGVAAGIRKGSVAATASDLYSIDLLGSAIGAYAVSVFAVPRFGVTAVSYGVAGLALAAALLSLWRRPSSSLRSA